MKLVKFGFKPLAFLLLMTVTAMVVTHDVIYGSDETKTVSTMKEVVVAGKNDKKSYKATGVSSVKYSRPLREIPQTIAVVPQAVVTDQNATTLREAVRNIPGISVQAGEGGVPAGDNLSIRGFNSRNDIFVDGVRDFGGYTRDPFNMEQLEVSKGPTSSYAGRGSAGGSVNQVSKTPRLDRFFSGAVGFGSGFYKRTTLDINQPLPIGIPGTAFRMNALLHDNDNVGRDKGENKRVGIAPSLAMGLGTAFRATISYFNMVQQNLPDYGIPWIPAANATGPLAGLGDQPAPVDWSNFYGIKSRDYEDIHVNMVTGKVEYDISDNIGFRNQLRYGHVMRDSIITAPRFSGATHRINRQMQSRDQIDTILNNQTDFTFKFDTGPVGHTLITGIEYSRENSDNTPRSAPAAPLADLFNPQFDDPFDSGTISTAAKANEATTDTLGLYSFDTIALHEKLDLVGGIRWDYFDLDYSPSVGPDLQRIDRTFSWRGGVVFKPVPIGSIYFGYGTSFNPTGEGLTASTTASATNNIMTDPEKTRTFEIGTKWDLFKERLALTSSIFHTEKTNARTTDPGGLAATTDDVIVLSGKQRIYGIEFGASGNVTKDWKVYGGYTALNGEIAKSLVAGETGKDLINTPQQSMTLWTTYALPFNFEVGGGMQYTGVRFANTINTRKAPEYWLFDLMAAYHLNDHITFRVNANNITDQEYIGSVGGGHFIPGIGRTIVGSTEFEF